MPVVQAVRTVANRAKREVVARVPAVNRAVRSAYEARVRAYAPQLPVLTADDHALVQKLSSEGLAKTSLDALGLARVASVKLALDQLVTLLAARKPGSASVVRPSPEELLADVALWQCGLDHRLLALAENYIGLPVRYYGAAVFRQVADGKTVGTRQWHRDVEDHRMMKVLVWLDDVGPRDGATEYLPKPLSKQAVRELHYVAGFVPDESVSAVAPPEHWVKATGPRWTAVFVDPAQILHRGSPAETKDRYSVTFTWTSRHPVKTMPAAENFSASAAARLRSGLDAAQLACLPLALQA